MRIAEEELGRVGLELNRLKTRVYAPHAAVASCFVPDGVKVDRTGAGLVGFPVGSDASVDKGPPL